VFPSVLDWVKSHGFETRAAGEGAHEVGIPWVNREKGTRGVKWYKFKTLQEARDALGY